MITLKYEKTDCAVYVSHIDILRNMVRIIRRAKLDIKFSQGFNPHMLLFFSPPLALGVASKAEYVTCDIDNIEPGEFLKAFNSVTSQGITGINAFYTEKSPNLAGRIEMATYEFPIADSDKRDKILDYINTTDEFLINYKQKKKDVTKDVKDKIISCKPYENGLVFGLATGNNNLRADRVLNTLQKQFNTETNLLDIVKTAQFVKINGEFIDVQTLLNDGGIS